MRFRQYVGSLAGSGAFYFVVKARRRAVLQLQMCLPTSNGALVTRSMFRQLGRSILESMNFAPLLTDAASQVILNNPSLVQELRSSGVPVVALSAHLSNWGLLLAYFSNLGFKLSIVARREGREFRYSHPNVSYIELSKDTTEMRAAIALRRAVKGGHVLAGLIDLRCDRKSCEHVPFFGQPVRCSAGLVRLARLLGARLVAAFVTFESSGSYHVFVTELDLHKSDREVLIDYHEQLEALIRRHPEQWVWFHNKWTTRQSTPSAVT